jgi:hypothetical protein
MATDEKLRKVTLMLPKRLIEEAVAASGVGLTPTVRQGLQSVVAAKAYADARALRGKVKFSLDFDALRRDDR